MSAEIITLKDSANNSKYPQTKVGAIFDSDNHPLDGFKVVDNLTTNDATKALSAKQGKVLNDNLSQLGQEVDELNEEVYASTAITENITVPTTLGSTVSKDVKYDVNLPKGRTFTLNVDTWSNLSALTIYFEKSDGTTGAAVRIENKSSNVTYYGLSSTIVNLKFTAIDTVEKIAFYATSGQVTATGNTGISIISEEIPSLREDTAELRETKLSKIIGANLINPQALTYYRYINTNGNIASSSVRDYCISPKIPVSELGMICNGHSGTNVRAYVVYNAAGEVIRVAADNTYTYTYQSGDAYIRFGFRKREDFTPTANVGTTLTTKAYTDYLPVQQLQENVQGLTTRVDKIEPQLKYYTPTDEEISGKQNVSLVYINSSGKITTAAASSYTIIYYPVVANTAYAIKANGIAQAGSSSFRLATFTTSTPAAGVTGTLIFDDYEVPSGFLYVFTPMQNGYIALSNRSGTLKLYSCSSVTLQKELDDIEKQLNEIAPQVSFLSCPHVLYKVWNDLDVERQNVAKLGLSRVTEYSTDTLNKDITFGNKLRFMPIVPTAVTQQTETTLNIVLGANSKSCTIRNVPASLSSNVKPRILVIGDSVTNGYGGSSNKQVSWHPSHYWAFAKMLFEMDKIDNGDTGHDILFIGSVTSDDFTINYKSISRYVRSRAVAKGGATLNELFTQYWGEGGTTPNPFYDNINNTFSIAAFLNNYRTMDDLGVRLVSASTDPHGESVVGSDGNTYTIGQKITTQAVLASYDVCTPTHVFINLNHNTTKANFEAKIADVVSIVKTELPDAIFAWLDIDSTGTNFPMDYPDFDQEMIKQTGPHAKNLGFYDYFHENLENEEDGIYLLGMNFIQPEAIDYAFTEIESTDMKTNTFKIANRSVEGRTYHPNNIAHCAWGYELYAFIKWLISSN